MDNPQTPFGIPGGPRLRVETPDGTLHTQDGYAADGGVYDKGVPLPQIGGQYTYTAPTPANLK